ncbi:sensor histidine kinase [Inconstantimicrobium mannanitabidum]|uniref:Two-component sensor histidine kinase n=1 Tax=Inconstantimicrobium mannanitabidum TaxID=1604901 RepID=A0ACB5RAN9_9CLOT|nr:HAMP domain-containing sensor histidine kinase [Clostridium sp. TW13]GKX66058.1 two-component sensor histidine kinase [Clostridium sp. TW13]
MKFSNMKFLKSYKNSISKRLFLVTFTFIILFMVFSMIFQIFFFHDFYASKKKNTLIHNIDKFKSTYSYNISDDATLTNALIKFESSNNSKIAILTTGGGIKYLVDKNSSYQRETVDLLIETFNNLSSNPNFIPDLLSSDKTYATTLEKGNVDLKHIVCISPMSMSSKNDSIIIAITSYQSINEASSIIKEFYSYVLIVLLFLGFILAFIYSNMISKPLIEITKIAGNMSKLDFSAKCPECREDEIGDIGKSLNFLSRNLSKALTELHEKNIQLTKDIEQERKLEKMRKEFIAGASHELKTPLGIIEGYAEGLKDGIVEGESKDIYLDTIIDEAHKMNKLIMDMLELSKLESGNIKLDITSFNLKELIADLLSKHKNSFIKNKLYISFILNDISSEYVNGDSFKIESVIENFITNAIKYTPEGGNINIALSENQDHIFFSIENTGVHLKPEDLEKIWVQFYRVDKARSRAEGSNGLGLSIVKNILTQHNSTFGVTNTPKGVLFYFSLDKTKEV